MKPDVGAHFDDDVVGAHKPQEQFQDVVGPVPVIAQAGEVLIGRVTGHRYVPAADDGTSNHQGAEYREP
jgi:hypothetical protein